MQGVEELLRSLAGKGKDLSLDRRAKAQQEALQMELDGYIAADCPLCGYVMVQSLALPLVSDRRPIHVDVDGELISKPYVDITLALLQRFGIDVQRALPAIVRTAESRSAAVRSAVLAFALSSAIEATQAGQAQFGSLGLRQRIGSASAAGLVRSSGRSAGSVRGSRNPP